MPDSREEREPRYGTVTCAMDYGQVGRNTVYRAIARGDIKAYKAGRVLRVDLNSMDAWLKPVRSAALG